MASKKLITGTNRFIVCGLSILSCVWIIFLGFYEFAKDLHIDMFSLLGFVLGCCGFITVFGLILMSFIVIVNWGLKEFQYP